MYTFDYKEEQCRKANLSNLMTREKGRERTKWKLLFFLTGKQCLEIILLKDSFFMFQMIKYFFPNVKDAAK